jgi:hypothetical protein
MMAGVQDCSNISDLKSSLLTKLLNDSLASGNIALMNTTLLQNTSAVSKGAAFSVGKIGRALGDFIRVIMAGMGEDCGRESSCEQSKRGSSEVDHDAIERPKLLKLCLDCRSSLLLIGLLIRPLVLPDERVYQIPS